jgi:hypothetical protein
MKKALAPIFVLILTLTLLAGCGAGPSADPDQAPLRLALVPLDSRPCNTQYPLLLNQAAGASLETPPQTLLGDLTAPADSDALLRWLDEQDQADEVILFANTLLNGGLVASRQAQAYEGTDDRLEALADYCRSHESVRITVVDILPRLIPSQFDPVLAPYADALRDYGMAWDGADAAGEEIAAPADIPADALETYRALQEAGRDQALALNDLADQGLIDRLIVSADDGAAHCPANITFRALEKDRASATTTARGADELTMLLVAQACASHADLAPTPVRLVWSDPEAADRVYPYESQTAAAIVEEKMALAGLTPDDSASRTLYIHADSADAPTTLAAIRDNADCLALADIAQTNRGDAQLQEVLLDPIMADAVTFYAGWNTAGNSIGTVCAALRIADLADHQDLSDTQEQDVFRALESFRALRLGEDQLWMASLAPGLQEEFMSAGLCDTYTVFASASAARTAQRRLDAAWTSQNDRLAACMNTNHILTLGDRTLAGDIKGFSSAVAFPWNRAFEIRLTPSFD